MAKKEYFIPGFPDRVEPPKIKPVYKSRKDWNKLVQEQLQFFRKYEKRESTRGFTHRYDYDGAMIKRRIDTLLDSIESVYERYKFLIRTDEHPNALGEEWIHLNLNFSSYTIIEMRSYILLGAAIWILDHITNEREKRLALYPLLPTHEDVWEDVNSPDIWDTQHDEDLIASVQYVLHFRNSVDGSVERDGDERERVLTDNITAEGAHHRETPYRKSYDGLIGLIPQEDIDRAVQHYEEYFWAWADRYFECARPLLEEYDRHNEKVLKLGERFNELRDEVRLRIEEHEKKMRARKKMNRQGKHGPVAQIPQGFDSIELPALGALAHGESLFQKDYSSTSPEMAIATDPELSGILAMTKRMDRLGDEYDDAVDVLHDLIDKRNRFLMQFVLQGRLSKQECLERYGPEVAEHMEPISISDPFEICFALLYLIDQGNDLPWLYGVGTGMLNEVTESLPWGIIEYDETDDEVVFGESAAKRPSAMPDWYERTHNPRSKTIIDYPRSLAQLVYEETGCIMPRDMHRFDSELKMLGRYGVRGKDALMMLACMTVLSHTRRRTHALNFDPAFLDYLQGEEDTENTDFPIPRADEEDERTTALRAEIKRLKSALHDSEKAARETRKELAVTKEKAELEHRELADLREVVFNQERAEQDAVAIPEDIFPYEVHHNTVIFGGHATWEKAIKPLLVGSVRFIPRDLIFDVSIVRNAEAIWIQTNAISHTQYYRVVDTARVYGKPIRYFAFASAEKCARQLVDNDV